jgi:peptide/nickel transport system substrate-binding protein
MDQLLKSEFASQPTVSTGPFRLVRYVPDQFAELERNQNYWGKRPNLDKVFIKIMTPETAVVQLEKGELEVIPGEISGELPPAEALRLKQNPDITVTSYPNNNTETLYPNIRTMFADARVRQAMMYAIDREAIVRQVLLGFGKVAYSVYPEFSPYYLPDLNTYPYDPERAKQLLSEAKWDSSQQPNFILPTGDTTREQVGTIIHQYLQAVGINAKIERTDFATMVNRLTRTHTFDLALAQNRGFNNLDLSRRFHTKMLDAGVNSGGYSNPELDKLMEEARSKVRFEEQKPLTDRIQRIINQDVPTVMLYYRDSIGAVNTKRLGGAVPRYRGVHRTMAEWFLK